MTNRVLAGAVLAIACVLASGLWAKQGTVKTKDGLMYEGEVTEKEEKVLVKTKSGIEMSVDKSQVEEINYAENVQADFDARLAKLDANDAVGRIALARWAYDQHKYDLARKAANGALDIDPNNRDASDLIETIRKQVQLESNGPGTGTVTTPTHTTTAPVQNDHPSVEGKYLTADQINTVKQNELKASDTTVRIRFEGDVLRRFAQATARDMTDFKSLKPLDQAMAIFHEGDPELRKDVRIMSDPGSMVEYKRDIQNMVLKGCATAACHGSAAGGSFVLFSPSEGDAGSYTNFYILSTYANASAPKNQAFGTRGRMIDRSQPTDSLLLDFALPPNLVEHDHPDLNGTYRGTFSGREDPRYKTMSNWISRSLVAVDPVYGIDYTPPGHVAAVTPTTSQPTTAPSTQPAAK